jgi:hypothetical protein
VRRSYSFLDCKDSTARNALCRILACFAVLALSNVSPGAAQSRASLDVTVGAGFGASSAPHGSSGGLSADAVVGFRPRTSAAAGLVVALSGAGQAFGVHEACDVPPGGACTPEFPVFWMVSALAGWETANEVAVARFLVGPAMAMSSSTNVGAGQVRLDLAKPISRDFSLLISGRVAYIPKYRGDSFSLASVGVGFRIR